ncbi:AMP-binding protein [Nocardia sp. 2]|uniref:AMP-binding protein n=1 Tax=Nocardia acididurans TaxID=2802282 RepID=A0ABS1MEG3_9NOCA|nr:AMP-binding protein [Nocardia acididurans]MBL1079032.1 AMP-binding protein [Nocardia acididurans]
MCKQLESPVATLVPLRASGESPAPHTDPAAVAVTAGNVTLTYAELDRWSNRLARMLLRLGARPGTRVAIAETPQLEAIVARLAIAKTGATPVPFASTETRTSRVDFGVTTKEGLDLVTDSSRWLVLDERDTLVQYLTGSDAPLTDAELHRTRIAS